MGNKNGWNAWFTADDPGNEPERLCVCQNLDPRSRGETSARRAVEQMMSGLLLDLEVTEDKIDQCQKWLDENPEPLKAGDEVRNSVGQESTVIAVHGGMCWLQTKKENYNLVLPTDGGVSRWTRVP